MATENKQNVFVAVSMIISLLLLAAAGWALFSLVRAIGAGFVALPKAVAAAIVAGSTTVLVSVAGVLIAKVLDRRREIEQAQRPAKVEIYSELIEFFFRVIFGERTGSKPPAEGEMVQFFLKFTRSVIVWGSARVVKEYTAFRNQLITGQFDAAILQFETLLLAIREDLGHSNRRFRSGQLLGAFMNDSEQILTRLRQLRKT